LKNYREISTTTRLKTSVNRESRQL
jgi:hypothetical protein